MKKINKINTTVFDVKSKIQEILNIEEKNNNTIIDANRFKSFFKKERDISEEFTSINGFIEDDEITVLYKQWSVEIYTIEDLEENLDFILPYINYEIIYQDIVPMNISYYSTHNDLHTSSFFEIRENLLILHVGLYIKKSYDGDELFVSNAKLRIIVKNPTNINS